MVMDKNLVERAVAALQKHHTTSKKSSKPQLIEDDPLVSLVIAVKKIPNRVLRPLRIPLSHSLYSPDQTELCLITKRDKAEMRQVLTDKQVSGITKIIPIAKLKTNYKSFEAKRVLSASYDIFLAEKRIYAMLPRLLGKKFFEKKKFPIPVDLTKKDLAFEIQRARDSTYLHIGLGSCCAVAIGRIGFTADQLTDNILSAVKGLSIHIPLKNIQSIQIKTPESIALPIFNSLPPSPGLLPSIEPPSKRAKIETENSNTESESNEVDSEGEESRKRKRPRQLIEQPLERSLDYGSAEESQPVTVVKAKKPASKLSVRKVRGSTVRSSKYEKALRRRTIK